MIVLPSLQIADVGFAATLGSLQQHDACRERGHQGTVGTPLLTDVTTATQMGGRLDRLYLVYRRLAGIAT